MAIRIGFIQDQDTDNELERQSVLRQVKRITGQEATEAFAVQHERDLRDDADLLVVDYGGLHAAYGDVLQRWGGSVRRWAEEHPGRLVALWTCFTACCYRAVFTDEFGDLDNVLFCYPGTNVWTDHQVEGWRERLAAWLAAPADDGTAG